MNCPWCASDITLCDNGLKYLQICPFCGNKIYDAFIQKLRNEASSFAELISEDKSIISDTERLCNSFLMLSYRFRYSGSFRVVIREGVVSKYYGKLFNAKDNVKDIDLLLQMVRKSAYGYMQHEIGLEKKRIEWIDKTITYAIGLNEPRDYMDRHNECLEAALKALKVGNEEVAWQLLQLSYNSGNEKALHQIALFFSRCRHDFRRKIFRSPLIIESLKREINNEKYPQYYLGLIYAYGIKEDINREKAYLLFLRDNKNAEARIERAVRLFFGIGCEKDPDKACGLLIDESRNNNYYFHRSTLKLNAPYAIQAQEIASSICEYILEQTNITDDKLQAFWIDYFAENLLLNADVEYDWACDGEWIIEKYVNAVLSKINLEDIYEQYGDFKKTRKTLGVIIKICEKYELSLQYSLSQLYLYCTYLIDERNRAYSILLKAIEKQKRSPSANTELYDEIGALLLKVQMTHLINSVYRGEFECYSEIEGFRQDHIKACIGKDTFDELMFCLGLCYLAEGPSKNEKKGKEQLIKCIKEGRNSLVLNHIGFLYLKGWFELFCDEKRVAVVYTAQDYLLAYQAFLKAWDINQDIDAAYNLATMFEKGISPVGKDLKEAVRLYNIAANNNDKEAKEWLIGHRIYGMDYRDVDYKELEVNAFDVINADVDVTQDNLQKVREGLYRNQKRLVIEEEEHEAEKEQDVETPQNNSDMFTSEQKRVLAILLNSKKIKEDLLKLEEEFLSSEVIIESINQKAVDLFGDILIEENADEFTYQIVPEYQDICRKVIDGSWKI